MHFVYILRCADRSYYTGITHALEKRIAEHNAGAYVGYTSARLPVILVWSESAPDEHQALLCERQIKGWSRAKKEALIHGGFACVHDFLETHRQRRRATRTVRAS